MSLDTPAHPDPKRVVASLSQERVMAQLSYPTPTNSEWFFRLLTEQEVKEFRQNARENYEPFTEINGIWHPIYQEECVKINHEHSIYTMMRPEDDS